MLGRNLDPIIYKDVLAELSKSISVPAKKIKNWRHSWIKLLMTMFKFKIIFDIFKEYFFVQV